MLKHIEELIEEAITVNLQNHLIDYFVAIVEKQQQIPQKVYLSVLFVQCCNCTPP